MKVSANGYSYKNLKAEIKEREMAGEKGIGRRKGRG